MAFVTKTWKDRLVEFAGRRKLKNVSTNEEVLYDVSRSEGTVMQAGDSFNATNMNDLEQRIKTEFDNVNSSLNGLSFAQDADGNWGYKVGADAVVPFKSGYSVSELKTFTSGTLYSAETWTDTKFSGDISKIIAAYSHFSGTVNGNTRSAYGASVFDSKGGVINLNDYISFKIENGKLYVMQNETAGSIPGYVKVCYTI